ncbi:YceD family protein [Aquibacillus sp. 3ASR75-11]|uniref:YceD family protein n=1 Tax=Terrihalobacillus insolitus TaxID=2950438 RepID=A0A9X3WTP8_9BACI|nr:YceD family protein [Terrihalobacillus insolitus]MDC3412817.1 YceD family protein [Terrihalobacillus insolitus]MDC3423706.1 YceD family protein [Terrihalobacillus insolitus]
MKFPIQKFKINGSSPYYFEEFVNVSELEEMNNDIRKMKPVHVKGQGTMQGNEITLDFTIDGEMVLPCARTLADVPYPFHIKTKEIFSTSPYYKEGDESEIHPIDGEILDLTPYIKENVLLEVPFRVFSKDEKVLENAITKGEGWELTVTDKVEKKVDPRLQKLQSLLDDDDIGENR